MSRFRCLGTVCVVHRALGSLACVLLNLEAVPELMRARAFDLNFSRYAMETPDPAATEMWKGFLRAALRALGPGLSARMRRHLETRGQAQRL